MWEIPSFIGHSEKKKYNAVKTISDKLAIEREADLRQKKKKILQRLKQNPEPEEPCDERNSHSSSTLTTTEEFISRTHESNVFDGVQKPRIFSRKTAPRGSNASTQSKQSESLTLGRVEKQRKLEATTNERTAKGNNTKSRIPIPNPCASPPRTSYGKNIERRTRGFENSGDVDGYIPSFSSESLRKSDHNKRVSMIKQTVSKRNEEMSKKQLNSRESGLDVSEDSTKNNSRITPPLINIERTATPSRDMYQSGRNSPETTTTSASKQHSSTHLYAESETGMFMSKSLTSLRNDDFADSNISRSLPLSPALARKQQTKLEEDFKRVEANLDQTFKELRKYLRTS